MELSTIIMAKYKDGNITDGKASSLLDKCIEWGDLAISRGKINQNVGD
jgi:hypothetical protein